MNCCWIFRLSNIDCTIYWNKPLPVTWACPIDHRSLIMSRPVRSVDRMCIDGLVDGLHFSDRLKLDRSVDRQNFFFQETGRPVYLSTCTNQNKGRCSLSDHYYPWLRNLSSTNFLPSCELYVKLQNSEIIPFSYKIKGSKDTNRNDPVDQNFIKSPSKKMKSAKNWEY